jgi:hypothetical protein
LRVLPSDAQSFAGLGAATSTRSGQQARSAKPEQGKGAEQHRQRGGTREGQPATGRRGRHPAD